jgi:hypothetical protein
MEPLDSHFNALMSKSEEFSKVVYNGTAYFEDCKHLQECQN